MPSQSRRSAAFSPVFSGSAATKTTRSRFVPFRDVVGHRTLVTLLSRAADSGAILPTLLFAGPSGVGKRLVAVATAQALNCVKPRRDASTLPLDACGTCAVCDRIARGVHPDVPLIGPGESGSIKIDPVREVIERAAYLPFEARRRVVIIDEADALVVPAQHALLKTLEEPPSASMFLLITSRPDALLPTVQSRCPRLRFRPLGPEEVTAALVARGKSDAEARAIAATAEGSVGRAFDASADDLIEARAAAMRVLAQAAQTQEPRRRIESARDLLANAGGGGAGDREAVATTLRAMASLLRDAALLGTRADRRGLANSDMLPELERLSGAFSGERGVQAFGVVDQALAALERNAGAKVVADWVVVSL
jgi:DNA polymerase-3 subunit delta'